MLMKRFCIVIIVLVTVFTVTSVSSAKTKLNMFYNRTCIASPIHEALFSKTEFGNEFITGKAYIMAGETLYILMQSEESPCEGKVFVVVASGQEPEYTGDWSIEGPTLLMLGGIYTLSGKDNNLTLVGEYVESN